MDLNDDDAPVPARGTVVEEGRGAAPFALVHGVAQVAWAPGAAGVTACVRACRERDEVVVATGPDGQSWSPMVLPARVVSALDGDVVARALRAPDLGPVVGRLERSEKAGGRAILRVEAPRQARPASTDAEQRDLEADTVPGQHG